MTIAAKICAAEVVSTTEMVLTADPHIGDMPCPHCGHETFRRSSRLITPTYREIFFACRNIAAAQPDAADPLRPGQRRNGHGRL